MKLSKLLLTTMLAFATGATAQTTPVKQHTDTTVKKSVVKRKPKKELNPPKTKQPSPVQKKEDYCPACGKG